MLPNTAALSHEWTTLQNNYEQAERNALLVKLVAVVLCAGGYALGVPYELIGGTAALLWVQESLCRTFQARLGERIVRVEALVKNAAPAAKTDADFRNCLFFILGYILRLIRSNFILGGPEGRAVATRSLVCGQGQPTKGAQTKAPSLPRLLSVKEEIVVQILETWILNDYNHFEK